MSPFILIENEKAYNLRTQNVFTIVSSNKKFQPNKIELNKILVKNGFNPIHIRVINPYQKVKTRSRRGNVVKQFRPKKYLVKLPANQIFNEETTINL